MMFLFLMISSESPAVYPSIAFDLQKWSSREHPLVDSLVGRLERALHHPTPDPMQPGAAMSDSSECIPEPIKLRTEPKTCLHTLSLNSISRARPCVFKGAHRAVSRELSSAASRENLHAVADVPKPLTPFPEIEGVLDKLLQQTNSLLCTGVRGESALQRAKRRGGDRETRRERQQALHSAAC